MKYQITDKDGVWEVHDENGVVIRNLIEPSEDYITNNPELQPPNDIKQQQIDKLTKENEDLRNSIDETNSLLMDLVNILLGE